MGGGAMILYAIKVVPPEWEEAMPIPFTQAEHDQWGAQLQNGTRVLIFKDAPINQLIGEGEVHGFFVQPDRWTPTATDGLPPSLRGADYLLPLGMLYTRKTPESMISLHGVRAALDDPTFPRSANEWRPLEFEQYQRLIREFP
jgi:hypothetical protein